MDISIREAQEKVDEWIQVYGKKYFSELTNMALLTEEVGELARIISRKYGEQTYKESDLNSTLEEEIADVLWVLLCLANQTNIDITEAFHKNIEKKIKRDATRYENQDN
ncbi:MAG: nucleotide pyrophosphohydrolase [Chitinophagaceae bacterium]|nr:nucleotide pyrophosphohydrolase [Chitinophagaceae bacterium]